MRVLEILMGILMGIPDLLGMILFLASPVYIYHRIKLSDGIKEQGLGSKAKPSGWTSLWYFLSVFFGLSHSISIVHQFGYQTRASEAKANLGVIYAAQQAYHVKYGKYASGESTFQSLDWKPLGQNRYAYYCDQGVISSKLPTDWKPLSVEDWPFTIPPQSSPTGFVCFAAANLDNDSYLDIWMINEQKQLEQVQDDWSDGVCKDIYKPWLNLPRPVRKLRILLSYHHQVLHCAAAWILLLLFFRGFYYDKKRYDAAMAIVG